MIMEQDKNKGTDSSAGVKTPNPPQIMHPNSPKEREEKKAPAEKSDDKKQSGNSTPKK
jgi:hypothetical protein